MQSASLPRLLAQLFAVLFYGLIAAQLYLFAQYLWFAYVADPTAMLVTDRNPNAVNVPVHVDSVRVGNRIVYAERIDTAVLRRTTFEPNQVFISSISTADSVFSTNLDVDYVVARDGYMINRKKTGYNYWLALPVGGFVFRRLLTPESLRRGESFSTPNPWQKRLSEDPDVTVSEIRSYTGDQVIIRWATAQGKGSIPFSVKIAASTWSWLPLLLLFALYQFMKLFQAIDRNDVFNPQQVRRINYIGYAALLYTVLDVGRQWHVMTTARQYLASLGYAHEFLYTTSVKQSLTIQWSWLLMGLCILALAQVFRYGMQLKQENELTI